jgi:signal transduction histidine kinase
VAIVSSDAGIGAASEGARGDLRDVQIAAARFALTSRLFDSLLHDVRNPLNALSINLDVLTEKVRGPDGRVPPALEKNLKAMRDQIFRVDGILRQFAEVLVPHVRPGETRLNVSELLQKAQVVAGHEFRRSRVQLNARIDPEVVVVTRDTGAVGFIIVETLLRAVARSAAGEAVDLSLGAEGSQAVLRILDATGVAPEPTPGLLEALPSLERACGAHVRINRAEVEIRFSLS